MELLLAWMDAFFEKWTTDDHLLFVFLLYKKDTSKSAVHYRGQHGILSIPQNNIYRAYTLQIIMYCGDGLFFFPEGRNTPQKGSFFF
jgi:hypothetical protein